MNSTIMAHRAARVARVLTVPLALVALSSCGSDETPAALVGYRPSAEQVVDTVTLSDASDGGAPFEFRAPEGGLLVTYFGYTSCPDVCPTTLAALKSALRDLGTGADRVEVAMATIDPARDSAEVISNYVQSFVAGAHGLRTDDTEQLRAATEAFGVSFGVDTNAEGEIEVSHTGSMYAVDHEGHVVLTWPFGITSDDLASDLGILLGEIDA